MRFTLLTTFLSSIAFAVAHIESVSGPTTYKPNAHSTYPLTFKTANGPITNEDFSVAVGLISASTSHGPSALGTFVHNFDLENTGHGSTGTGSFTLQVPLPASSFVEGSGKYIVTAAVTNAVGALWNVQLRFFSTPVTVTGV